MNKLKATKISMKPGCISSNNLCEIDSIYLEQIGAFLKKETIYDYLSAYPQSIYVDIFPYPYLEPVSSATEEKYVRSEADFTKEDNLLRLPRE